MQKDFWEDKNIVEVLTRGGVVVMPTDTIYGMLGKAENQSAVENIYKIRNRDERKPCIILIGDISELNKFSVHVTEQQKVEIEKYWSTSDMENKEFRPVSIVLDCLDNKFKYLHRGTNTLAFRMPAIQPFRNLLLKTGPVIAPSANLEKFPENENIQDARKYFGDKVDLYVDGGEVRAQASKVIRLHTDGSVDVLRA